MYYSEGTCALRLFGGARLYIRPMMTMMKKALPVLCTLLYATIEVAANDWDSSFQLQEQQGSQESWEHGIVSPDKFLLQLEEQKVYIDPTDAPEFHASTLEETEEEEDPEYEIDYEKGFEYDVEEDDYEMSEEELEEYYATKTTCHEAAPTSVSESVEPFADIPSSPADLNIPTLQTKLSIPAAAEHLDHFSDLYVDLLKQVGIENLVKGAWGMTYSFYRPEGGCKAPQEIQDDIAKLGDFEIIRVYDTDCEGILNVMKLLKPHQKLFAGIYYLDRIDVSAEIIHQAVMVTGGDWSKVHTVSVGNELVNFGRATTLQVAALLDRAKTVLRARGYTGYVVTTDTLVAMLNNKELCHIGDYVSVNSHPYWDGLVHPQDSGPWLVQQLDMLRDVCGATTPIVLCETGWPTRGLKFGEKGVPSKANQLIALKSIVDTLGFKTILFTTYNDYWKADGTHGVEKFWGIFDE